MRINKRQFVLALIASTLAGSAMAQQPPAPDNMPGSPPAGRRAFPDPYVGKKKVLFIADTSTGNQVAHDSTSHAMARMEEVLRKAGFAVFLRTDMKMVTKSEVWGTGDYAPGGKKQSKGRNLNFFDVVVLYINGEPEIDAKSRQDLLDFLAKDGKGLVGIHTATSAGYYWPEYGKMIGGYFDNHPWNIADAKVVVERPDFPGMSGFVANSDVRDEFYAMTDEPYSRKDVDVLMRLDTRSVDLKNPQNHRTDGDFPQAWIKNYGKGRVFYSALGHPDAAWDDPRVQNMYLEAIKWAAGMTAYPVRPHPLPHL